MNLPPPLLFALGDVVRAVRQRVPDGLLEGGGVGEEVVLERLDQLVRSAVVDDAGRQSLVANPVRALVVVARVREPVHRVTDLVVEGEQVAVASADVFETEPKVVQRRAFGVGQVRLLPRLRSSVQYHA